MFTNSDGTIFSYDSGYARANSARWSATNGERVTPRVAYRVPWRRRRATHTVGRRENIFTAWRNCVGLVDRAAVSDGGARGISPRLDSTARPSSSTSDSDVTRRPRRIRPSRWPLLLLLFSSSFSPHPHPRPPIPARPAVAYRQFLTRRAKSPPRCTRTRSSSACTTVDDGANPRTAVPARFPRPSRPRPSVRPCTRPDDRRRLKIKSPN